MKRPCFLCAFSTCIPLRCRKVKEDKASFTFLPKFFLPSIVADGILRQSRKTEEVSPEKLCHLPFAKKGEAEGRRRTPPSFVNFCSLTYVGEQKLQVTGNTRAQQRLPSFHRGEAFLPQARDLSASGDGQKSVQKSGTRKCPAVPYPKILCGLFGFLDAHRVPHETDDKSQRCGAHPAEPLRRQRQDLAHPFDDRREHRAL